MTLNILFWVIMLVWLLFGLWVAWPSGMRPVGNVVLIWVLLAILGWQVFGPAIHR